MPTFEDSNKNKVRIKIKGSKNLSNPDEYLPIDSRPQQGVCQVYLSPPVNESFVIEVTLMKGYKIDGCLGVRAYVYLGSDVMPIGILTFDDLPDVSPMLTKHLRRTNYQIGARVLSNAKMSIIQLGNDMIGKDTTNIAGIRPSDVGRIRVRIERILKFNSYPRIPSVSKSEQDALEARQISNVTKVNDQSSKKGITLGVNLYSGAMSEIQSDVEYIPTHVPDQSSFIKVDFYCRSKESIKERKMIPFPHEYPPPLSTFAWDLFEEDERRAAFEDIQTMNKSLLRQEAMTIGPNETQGPGQKAIDSDPMLKSLFDELDEEQRETVYHKIQAINKGMKANDPDTDPTSKNVQRRRGPSKVGPSTSQAKKRVADPAPQSKGHAKKNKSLPVSPKERPWTPLPLIQLPGSKSEVRSSPQVQRRLSLGQQTPDTNMQTLQPNKEPHRQNHNVNAAALATTNEAQVNIHADNDTFADEKLRVMKEKAKRVQDRVRNLKLLMQMEDEQHALEDEIRDTENKAKNFKG